MPDQVRATNRVVCVGETLRAALNTPGRSRAAVAALLYTDEWDERYAHRIEESRLHKGKAKRTAMVETIGADGSSLLDAIVSTPELKWLHHVPAVETAAERVGATI